MMIFDNVYMLLAIETILAIYLIDTYYKIKNDVPGNIYIKWNSYHCYIFLATSSLKLLT